MATEFLRTQVDGLEEWIVRQNPGLSVKPRGGSTHSIFLNGQQLGVYYFATGWIHFRLNGRVPGDDQDFSQLTNPASMFVKPTLIAGNIATEADLEIFKKQFMARVD